MEREAHELTPKEEAALDAWAAPAPAEGFRDRVLARLDREAEPARRSRAALWGGLVAAGVVAAVLGATLTLRGNRGADEGSVAAAAERTTARIARRAIAVLEAGSAVRWGRDDKGATRVEQASGNVFYRVDEGSAFYVVANEVSVRVTGTCFRVEVSDMKAKTAGALGTTIGAVASAVVLVTVYEGSVVTASPKGEAAVAAGQVAEVRGGAAPAVRSASVASMAASARAETQAVQGETSTETARDARAPAAVATLTDRERQLKAQAEKLQHEVEQMRADLARGGKTGATEYDKKRPHEMTQEDLLRAAKDCRLIWEYPHMHPTDTRKFSYKKAQAAGLTESEIDLANDVLKATSRALFETTRDLYRELTGDEVVGSLSAEAMQSEIWDKTPQDERARVFQRLARERAGLEKPPASLAGTTPFERGMRLMTGVADAIERDIGAKIGPDLARKLREKTRSGGWDSRSVSSTGCPKG